MLGIVVCVRDIVINKTVTHTHIVTKLDHAIKGKRGWNGRE